MTTRTLVPVIAIVAVLPLAVGGCDEDDLFSTTPAEVRTGESRIWELALESFPSGYDFALEQRLFVGTGPFSSSVGSFALAARDDGTLVFIPFSELAPGLSVLRTGIQDLTEAGRGSSFEAVTEVPEGGYTASDDPDGVPVVEGHVYAFQVAQTVGAGFVRINYAKLEATEVGREFADDPDSRFVRFRFGYQRQPLNRDVDPDEDDG